MKTSSSLRFLSLMSLTPATRFYDAIFLSAPHIIQHLPRAELGLRRCRPPTSLRDRILSRATYTAISRIKSRTRAKVGIVLGDFNCRVCSSQVLPVSRAVGAGARQGGSCRVIFTLSQSKKHSLLFDRERAIASTVSISSVLPSSYPGWLSRALLAYLPPEVCCRRTHQRRE